MVLQLYTAMLSVCLWDCSRHIQFSAHPLEITTHVVMYSYTARHSERNSHRQSPFTLGHHLPTVGAKSDAY